MPCFRLLLTTGLLLCGLKTLQASVVKASTLGYQPDDATQAFQSAINSGYDTVIVDLQATPWIVQPNTFLDLDGLTLIFEPGVEFVAKPGAFSSVVDCLLRFVRCQNLQIWGYGATFRMQKPEYTNGEWRHALSINFCKDVSVYGLTLRDSGGDGIYIGAEDFWGPGLFCESIYLRDCRCINNRRQGISVITVDGLGVDNCWFEDTNGTLPESGVDIEPDQPEYKIKNIAFRQCRFTGNHGNGIQVSLQRLTGATDSVSIVFEHCYVARNHHPDNPFAPAEVALLGAQTDAVEGMVSFRYCLVEDSPWSALYVRKPADAYFAEFHHCVFQDISRDSAFFYNQPIRVEVPSYSDSVGRYGGLFLQDCLIKYQTNTPWFRAYGWFNSPGLGMVQGDVYVLNPDSVGAEFGTDPAFADITVFTYKNLPKETIVLSGIDAVGYEPPAYHPIGISFTRTVAHSAPIAAKYALSGVAENGLDYSLLPGFAVVPISAQSILIAPLGDRLTEGTESLNLALTPTEDYQVIASFDTAYCRIMEASSPVRTPAQAPVTLYPNPAADFAVWPLDISGGQALVRPLNGGWERRIVLENNRLYVKDLPAGVYLVQVGARVGKLIKR